MKSKRSLARSRDRRSARVTKVQLVEPFPTASTSLQAISIQPEPQFEELLPKHRSLSGRVKAFLEPYYKSFPVFDQGPNDEADRARFERVFRPWPKWRFRLGAELWHVIYPTIESDVFFQTLRVLDVIAFRCPTNPSAIVTTFSKDSTLERIDVRAVPIIIASIHGHTNKHLEARRKSLGEKLA